MNGLSEKPIRSCRNASSCGSHFQPKSSAGLGYVRLLWLEHLADRFFEFRPGMKPLTVDSHRAEDSGNRARQSRFRRSSLQTRKHRQTPGQRALSRSSSIWIPPFKSVRPTWISTSRASNAKTKSGESDSKSSTWWLAGCAPTVIGC